MKRLFVTLSLLVIAAGVVGGVMWARDYVTRLHSPQFRTQQVTRGDLASVVNSTGEVKPVLSIAIGSFVSGPIKELYVDFNQEVRQGELLAEIDPRIYEALAASDRASLAIRQAEVRRVEAELGRAVANEKRAQQLLARGDGFISSVEVDEAKFSRQSLEAQWNVARAGVLQAQAAMKNSEANLGYTKITSPVDGIVIDRKIEPGQTLAAQFQTPELFTIAPDIRKEMHIFASVDEADIGLIVSSRDRGCDVEFSVDAYPDQIFRGKIDQVRLSPVINQSVVTYPVVVSTSNQDGKLMPGMTASLSFTIDSRTDVIRIPNAALRFFPDVEHVRGEDRALITGVVQSQDETIVDDPTATEKVDAVKADRRRHVWVWEGDKLRAIPVTVGIRDSRFSEMVDGELNVGDALVVGLKVDG